LSHLKENQEKKMTNGKIMCRRAGFTLIELLVVISIIALLMAILMPALSKVKDQAKAAICLSNMHQLGVAWQMYTSDNRQQFTHGLEWVVPLFPYYVNRKLLICGSASKPVIPPELGVPQRGGKFSPWVRWEHVDIGGATEYVCFIGSYGYNFWCTENTGGGRGAVRLWRKADVRRAAYAPILTDSAAVGYCPTAADSPPVYDGQIYFSEPEDIDEIRSACLNRHNEAVNVLFFDFSVRRTGLKELWLLWWHRDWPIPTAWPLPIWPAWMEHMKDPY